MNPDSVHYKIFLCAAGYEPEIRRITVDKDICHNYFYLKQKILAIFPTLKDVAFTISWKDTEGDNIRICTDDELVIALKEMESHAFKKIYVNATPQGKEGPAHPDVICDGCEHPLQGFRYKCLVCYDYDLCPDCERSQMHPDHPMIRIPLPLSSEMPFGRRFARDIAKMGKHLERLLHQTSDHVGDKKAKGDYSNATRCGSNDNRKQHKMKFCHHSNDMQNFLHNLVYSQLEKMRGSSSGDNNATSDKPQPDNSQPQASSSSDGYPIFEEQKKFVNILTNGLNSFLDPLGIDIVVEEDPVKEESPQKRPPSNQSENNSGADSGVSTSQATSSSTPAPIVNQPVSSSSRVQPQPSVSIGVQPSTFTIGVPPPSTMIGSQSSATVGAQASSTVGAQASPSIGFQLPAAIGVPPPATIAPPAAIGVQPPPRMTVGPQVPVSSSAVPVMIPTPVVPQANPTPQSQFSPQASPAQSSYQEEIPVLDSSWTIVNDGMGESMLIPTPAPAPQPVASPPQPVASSSQPVASPAQSTQETERIYPQLYTPAQLTTEEALNIMEQLGFKNEEWLRQLIENKKGNIQEVLNFLSPIPKPKPSTYLQ
ncbi:unnamed protein product [Nezara viridula]|uniref:ZZ-type domain-containing protein n=1 Tax=Nezara viridula TaxID=85310 RepID=A0A9P0DX49_NEZVI|nr:unnamed protein product [Nezara viridula]